MAQIIRDVSLVDWDSVIPRNIRFMKVRVWFNLNQPLFAGCMIRKDDRVLSWIEFRYEKVFKICRKCSIVGHTTPHYPTRILR